MKGFWLYKKNSFIKKILDVRINLFYSFKQHIKLKVTTCSNLKLHFV